MSRFWALVPAAGVGRRMQADRPKQYLDLGGRPVLLHTLEALYACSHIAGVVVARNTDDPWWAALSFSFDRPLWEAPGGAERADSVRNGLSVLAEHAHDDDWVLVHDAARPCLRLADIERLIETLRDHPVGGLLAVPVRDTMKQADAGGAVAATLDRSRLWHALTPQMFRLDALRQALARAHARGETVTDESSAMELAGLHPRLVEGHADNIKITRPEDLALAGFFLKQQGRL